jgi:hypothetical protein
MTQDNLTRLLFGRERIIQRAKHNHTKAVGFRATDIDAETGLLLSVKYPLLAKQLQHIDKRANMPYEFLWTSQIAYSPPRNTTWGKFLGVINGASLTSRQIQLDPREPAPPVLGEPRFDPDVHWLLYPPPYAIAEVKGSDVKLDNLPIGHVPISFDHSYTFQWPMSKHQQHYLKTARGKNKISHKIKRANMPLLCIEGKTAYGVQGSTYSNVIGIWPKGKGKLVASKMYTPISRPTGAQAYASLNAITVADLQRLYVPNDILAEERRLHRLAAITRLKFPLPGEAPAASDIALSKTTTRHPPVPNSTQAPRIPGHRIRPRPTPQPAQSPILAQTTRTRADGIAATLELRTKRARKTEDQ